MPRGVQNLVNGVPAPAVAGDPASANWNRYSVLSGPGGLVAGAAGVTVGQFAWLSQLSLDPDNAAQIVNSFGANGAIPDGFVSRPDAPAIITVYLADSTMLIQQGGPVPLKSGGDWWCINNGTTQALVGNKAYADFATGKVSFAATGTPSQATSTSTTVAAGTWSATGSITGNIMTVGAITGSQGAPIGATVTGTNVASGTIIIAKISATQYALNIGEQTVASGTSLSGTFGVLTVGGTITGTIEVGGLVAGTGIPSGSILSDSAATNSNLTGAGGAGTYVTTLTGTGGTGTITFNTNVETKWIARSSGNTGELVKISEVIQ